MAETEPQQDFSRLIEMLHRNRFEIPAVGVVALPDLGVGLSLAFQVFLQLLGLAAQVQALLHHRMGEQLLLFPKASLRRIPFRQMAGAVLSGLALAGDVGLHPQGIA